MKPSRFLPLLLLVLAPVFSQAQGEAVFKDKEVNESALIDALTPSPKFRTRSLTIAPDGAAAAAPAKRAMASMLITFESNSADLKPQAKKLLDELGKAMQSDKLAKFRFEIEGHADPRGAEQANLELSQRRAESVASYLAEAHRVGRERLKPVGKGQSEPINVSQPDAPENRRVTVKTVIE